MHYFPHIHLSPPSSRVSSSSLLLCLRGCAASLPPGLAAVGRWSVLVPGLRVCLAGASAAASSPPSSPAPNRGCHPRPLRGFRCRPFDLRCPALACRLSLLCLSLRFSCACAGARLRSLRGSPRWGGGLFLSPVCACASPVRPLPRPLRLRPPLRTGVVIPAPSGASAAVPSTCAV